MVRNETLKNNTPHEASLAYMIRLAAPMIITTISFTIMQFVDRFMVSRLGTEALAAILPASMTTFLPGSFAIGVSASIATFVSQNLGRGQKSNCSSYCWQAIYMSIIYFAVVIVILWPIAPRIFTAMGYSPQVVELEVRYFRISLFALLLAGIIWSGSQFFMGIHRPIITMYSALCGQVVNVTANYLLIFGKFGFPNLGIAGAAWGTFIGIAVGATIRMAVFLGPGINTEYKSRHTLKIDFKKMLDIIKIGFPAGLELMINVAAWALILLTLVGKFGKEASAATSAVFACTNVSVMPVVGLRAALTAAVGKAIGAGKKNIAVRQTGICMKIAIIYMGLIGICFLIFRNGIMDAWASDEPAIEQKVINIGSKILILAAIYQVFHAARIIYSGALRGAGDTFWLAVVSTSSAVIILGLGGWFLVEVFPGLGALGPWLAATLSIMAVGLANRFRFKSNKWKKIDLFKGKPMEQPIENEAAVE